MIASILAILATLIPWIGRRFSPESVLHRRELAEAEHKRKMDVEAEKLKDTYKEVKRETPTDPKDLADDLTDLFK